MAYFNGLGGLGNNSGWFDGVVVKHLGRSSYTVLYESDNQHEDWDLPDSDLVFMCESPRGDHIREVTCHMLPSLT